jgi:hypothetical protein
MGQIEFYIKYHQKAILFLSVNILRGMVVPNLRGGIMNNKRENNFIIAENGLAQDGGYISNKGDINDSINSTIKKWCEFY